MRGVRRIEVPAVPLPLSEAPGDSRRRANGPGGATWRLTGGAATLIVTLCSSCAIRPPHMEGETREAGSGGRFSRPEWTDWGVKVESGDVWVAGAATGYDRLETARKAAEEDARRRLAASVETRIRSLFEERTRTEIEARGDDPASTWLSRETRDRIESAVDATLRGTTPEDQHVREYEVFGDGWERRYDCWLLLRVSRREYDRQLEAAARGALR